MSVPYSELVIDKYVAENAFVKVYQGKWRNQAVAIKEVKDPSDPEKIEKLVEQAKILKQLKHPNITEFKCFVAEDPHYCIVLELSEGSISSHIHHDKKVLSTEELISFTLQIAKALKYLHSLNLIYGVLTTRKIQLNKNHVLLSDFFLTYQSYVQNDIQITPEIVEKVFGCPYFVPPEILAGENSTNQSDVYSLATVMWEMFSLDRLSREKFDTAHVIKNILEKNARPCSKKHLEGLIFENAENEKVSEYLKIIQSGWKKDPMKRLSIDEVIQTLIKLSDEQIHVISKVDSKEVPMNEPYEILKQIGIGGQARVYLVNRKVDNKKFALKKFNETPFMEVNKDLQEVLIHLH
jgi:serine/threonine protein kinase